MTYQDLIDQIASWIDRPDLASEIPSFIRMAEQMINRDLRILAMEKIVSTPGAEVVSLPDDFSELRNIYAGNKKLVYLTPEQFVQKRYPVHGGPATAYTILGNELHIADIPDTELVIHYFARFLPLSSTNTTNYLTENANDLLLYGSLIHAKGFLMLEPEQISEWYGEYKLILSTMNEEAAKARISGGRLRSTGPYAA